MSISPPPGIHHVQARTDPHVAQLGGTQPSTLIHDQKHQPSQPQPHQQHSPVFYHQFSNTPHEVLVSQSPLLAHIATPQSINSETFAAAAAAQRHSDHQQQYIKRQVQMSYTQQPPPQTPPQQPPTIPSPAYGNLQHPSQSHAARAAAMASAAAQSNAFFDPNVNSVLGMTRTGTTPNGLASGMAGGPPSGMMGMRSGSQGHAHSHSQSHSHGHSQSHGGGPIGGHTHGHAHSHSSPSLHHLNGVPTTPTLGATNPGVDLGVAGVNGGHAHRNSDAQATLAAQQLPQSQFANPGMPSAMAAPMPPTTGTAGMPGATPPQMAGLSMSQPPQQPNAMLQTTIPPSIPHTTAQSLAPPPPSMQAIHSTIPPVQAPMQTTVQPPIPPMGAQQPPMPPDETPLYVNAKQFHRIIKRRTARALLEEQLRRAPGNHGANGKAGRRPYLHESRHNHAMRRPRGPGGRFLTAEEVAAREKNGEGDSKGMRESADRETASESGSSKRKMSEATNWDEGDLNKKVRVDEG
ncbi:Transcriptional activator [Ascosphaera pollenicola]|nr:Transcriptional activator [Ascosphaera pollenicola]